MSASVHTYYDPFVRIGRRRRTLVPRATRATLAGGVGVAEPAAQPLRPSAVRGLCHGRTARELCAVWAKSGAASRALHPRRARARDPGGARERPRAPGSPV